MLKNSTCSRYKRLSLLICIKLRLSRVNSVSGRYLSHTALQTRCYSYSKPTWDVCTLAGVYEVAMEWWAVPAVPGLTSVENVPVDNSVLSL